MRGLLELDSTVRVDENFDEVTRRFQAKKKKVLFKTGGYGRSYIKQRIRRRKSVSPPGGYPYSHTFANTGFKDLHFAVENGETVTIGHRLYRQRSSVIPIGKTVPQIINEGGRARIASRGSDGSSTRHVRMRARPFRGLAFPAIARFAFAAMDQIPI